MAAEIPAFEGYVPFLDALHVEADCGYGAVGDELVRVLIGQMGGFVGNSEPNLEARGAEFHGTVGTLCWDGCDNSDAGSLLDGEFTALGIIR